MKVYKECIKYKILKIKGGVLGRAPLVLHFSAPKAP
jgi:hypothetical protein